MRMIALSLVSGICLLAATSAKAEGVALTDHQLDQVTAGALGLGSLSLSTLSTGVSLIDSPLGHEAAVRLALQMDDSYAQLYPGQSIVDAPVIGPATLKLYLWGLKGLQ